MGIRGGEEPKMERARRLLLVSIVLGILSLAAFILGRLAMTDIFHGEPDLTLEWRMVSISFLPILAFHVVSLVAALDAIRQIKRSPAAS
jgi:hypothetical protein